ncbi:hypothetical protein Tco_1538412 [Tanacetum coccineum]
MHEADCWDSKGFLVLLKLMLLVMIVTIAGYVSTAGEVQRKYSKSLLLLVVKLLLLVLVTTARRVSAVRVNLILLRVRDQIVKSDDDTVGKMVLRLGRLVVRLGKTWWLCEEDGLLSLPSRFEFKD